MGLRGSVIWRVVIRKVAVPSLRLVLIAARIRSSPRRLDATPRRCFLRLQMYRESCRMFQPGKWPDLERRDGSDRRDGSFCVTRIFEAGLVSSHTST
jgi:hypothetical protein